MEIEEFKKALDALGWKQSDFCSKTKVGRNTTSRWLNGHTPVPEWVPSYLEAMQAIQTLHAKFVAVTKSAAEGVSHDRAATDEPTKKAASIMEQEILEKIAALLTPGEEKRRDLLRHDLVDVLREEERSLPRLLRNLSSEDRALAEKLLGRPIGFYQPKNDEE
jgi:transcriptional regulator with XRE-family HTH domain